MAISDIGEASCSELSFQFLSLLFSNEIPFAVTRQDSPKHT